MYNNNTMIRDTSKVFEKKENLVNENCIDNKEEVNAEEIEVEEKDEESSQTTEDEGEGSKEEQDDSQQQQQ